MSTNYNKVWKVKETEINDFIVAWNNGSVADSTYTIPPDILSWPANGPAGYSQQLSPFYDNNFDAIYNPYDGDYPIIKGTQMLRRIFNDNYSIHTETDGPALGAEVQANFYGCSSSNINDPINRTTFLEYTIINRSDSIYKDLYLGFNTDADIGCYIDDYVRSNVNANTMQFYNADSYDGSCGGAWGYYGNPPVQSFSILDIENISTQPLMNGFMHYQTSGGPDGDPSTLADQYNYLRSIWKDDSLLTYGGYGFGGTVPCRYMFPGDSDPSFIGTYGVDPGFYWTEENTDGLGTPNPADDRRGVMSAGPFILLPNGSIKITFALITTQDSTITIDSLLQKNIVEVNAITQQFAAQNLPCQYQYIGIEEQELNASAILYPNPARDLVNIKSNDPVYYIEIFNLQGESVKIINGNNQFSVEDIPAGMYFAKIYFENRKTVQVEKILIVK